MLNTASHPSHMTQMLQRQGMARMRQRCRDHVNWLVDINQWVTVLMLCIFTSRCVSVCCADLLAGLVVHLPVYPGSHVSVLSQTAQRKRYSLFCFPLGDFVSTRATFNSSDQLSFLSFFSPSQQAIYWSSVQKAGTIYTAFKMEYYKLLL